jgi:hypothetical protein
MTNVLIITLACFLLAYPLSHNLKGPGINEINQLKENNMDFDLLDAYKLKLRNAFLFGRYDSLLANLGLPNRLTVIKTDYSIKSKTDLDKAISTATDPDPVTLHYPGIDIWYTYDNSVVPFTVDFRKLKQAISYGEIKFDNNYKFGEFKKQFPNSANPSFSMPQSFFEITTKEKAPSFKSFILKRKTKSDPNAEPLVEFTFDGDRLIFIIFANF